MAGTDTNSERRMALPAMQSGQGVFQHLDCPVAVPEVLGHNLTFVRVQVHPD